MTIIKIHSILKYFFMFLIRILYIPKIISDSAHRIHKKRSVSESFQETEYELCLF